MNKKWAAIIFSLLLCFLMLWGGYYLIEKIPAFQVARITITGTERCDRRDIEELAATAYGRCILKVDLPALYQKIKTVGWVKGLSIRRILPNTLQITIKERVPLGILDAGQQCLVDREGVVIAPVRDKKAWDLPVITGLAVEKPWVDQGGAIMDEPGGGSSLLKSAMQILKLMKDLKAKWLSQISEISLKDPENIILYNKNRGCEIRLGHSNLEEKIIYLQTIWDDIKARVYGIEYIDLRYKNQIVVKPEKHIG